MLPFEIGYRALIPCSGSLASGSGRRRGAVHTEFCFVRIFLTTGFTGPHCGIRQRDDCAVLIRAALCAKRGRFPDFKPAIDAWLSFFTFIDHSRIAQALYDTTE